MNDTKESLHTWTQKEITDWAVNQFGEPEDNINLIERASLEFDELSMAAHYAKQGIDTYEKAASEVADVVIILSQYLENIGLNLQDEINKKMKINSMRTWSKTGDGVGQHV